MPRSTKGRAAARGLDARLILQHASCLLEMLHSKQLRSIKMLLASNHGIYRDHGRLKIAAVQLAPRNPFRRSQIPAVIIDAVGAVLSLGKAMRRRDFIIVIAGSATFLSFAAHAQQQVQMRRIGVLESAGIETDQQAGVAVFK